MESKHQTLQGLAFPLQLDAQQAIQALKQKKINYIQLVGLSHDFSVPHSPLLLLSLAPICSLSPLSIRSWIWSGRPSTWCTRAPRRLLTCPRGSLRTLLATISSCTSIHTRETTWSLLVRASALGKAGSSLCQSLFSLARWSHGERAGMGTGMVPQGVSLSQFPPVVPRAVQASGCCHRISVDGLVCPGTAGVPGGIWEG